MNCLEADEMPLSFNGQLLTAVTPVNVWEELYATLDSAHFIEAGGDQYHDAVIKFRIPKDTPVNMATVMDLERNRWMVEITDRNGQVSIAGTKDEGCAIRRELRDKGQNRRDSNHYNMVILLTRGEPIPFAAA